MDANIKQIQITGPVATTMMPGNAEGGGKKKRGATRKNKKLTVETMKEGGGDSSPGTAVQLAASRVPPSLASTSVEGVVGRNSALTEAGAPVGNVAPSSQAGGKAPVKVVLKAAKKKTAKVVLAAPKAAAKPAVAAAHGGGKTRKAPRKIRVSMTGLSKKLTRAKSIRQDAAKTSLDQVKKTLQKAGLIKADSKAPEAILRQMYADFMVLKNRAL